MLNAIDAEYERIFGVSSYPNLYDSNDEEYNRLRQEIITAPRVRYNPKCLPCDDNNKSFKVNQKPETDIQRRNGISDTNRKQENSINCTASKITSLVDGIIVNQPLKKPTIDTQKHIFWLIKAGRCKAFGYFERDTKNFYIREGSLISIQDDYDYVGTSSYRNRHRIIDKNGIQVGNFIKIKKDTKCRSALTAACYVVGATVSATLWLDENGKSLNDIYPEYYFR